jgi:type III pantothenate kinase
VILQLDVGNSAIKWRLRDGRAELDRGTISREAGPRLPDLRQVPRAVWVASVAGSVYEEALRDAVDKRWGVSAWFARAEARACGVTNSYASPDRMGVDRWLAMIAAWERVGAAVCVVDAGSALTIDFLDGGGRHRGGYILPGLAMMERALLEGTDRVRFGDAPRDALSPGDSTETAVLNGLQLGQVGAVELALSRYGEGDALVFTGGNGAVTMRLLGRGGDFVEDLVLDGLAVVGSLTAAGANAE